MAKITASFVLDESDLEIIKDLAATGDFSDSAALRLIIREWSKDHGHWTSNSDSDSVSLRPSLGGDSRG